MIPQQWLLGFVAGVTIFLGFPIALLKRVPAKTKALLNAISTGILIFLLVEIAGHVLEEIEELIKRAASGQPGLHQALQDGGLFAAGFALGLLGLVYFEKRFLGRAKDATPQKRSLRVALMIAIGLGLHNFSEGLAIGQGYASGAIQLAWMLAIGFALHNATEGFGIAAPLSGQPVKWGFLLRAGLIAGGPTFLGAMVGGWWVNKPMEVFCLAMAAGTILYVVGELLHLGRQLKEESVVAVGLLIGFFIAVATDFALVGAMQYSAARQTAELLPGGTEEAQRFDQSLQEEHRPRHGGLFGDADDLYHYEVLLNERGQLVLYVNDGLNRPMSVRSLQGRWTLNPDDRSPKTGTFHPSADGTYFVADLPEGLANPESLHVEVEVLKGRQWVSMEFYVPMPHPAAAPRA